MLGNVVQHTLQLNGVVAHLRFAFARNVHRQQVVGRAQLHAVAGEIKQHFVAALQLAAEGAQRGLHVFLGDVGAQRHLVAHGAQVAGDAGGVFHRVGQGRDVAVLVVAHHQRQPAP